MTPVLLVLAAVAVAAVTGCANPGRSRDLANPEIAAPVMAQQVCSACHGMTGVSISPNFPHLAAQMPAYLAAQLNGFRSHARADPAGFEYMWGLRHGIRGRCPAQGCRRQGVPRRRRQQERAGVHGMPWRRGTRPGGLPTVGGPACRLRGQAARVVPARRQASPGRPDGGRRARPDAPGDGERRRLRGVAPALTISGSAAA